MLFNTIQFGIFFLIVLGLYSLCSRRPQNIILLIASYIFYGAWDWRFLLLIAISTLVDFCCGLQIKDTKSPATRKSFLALSVITNLGILAYFKYFNFFASSAASLLTAIGLRADFATLQIILPVGISFYTFQTMSYTIDVYRRKMPPCRDFLDFALFVSFFPQLVAGPIERASELLPRIQKPRQQTSKAMFEGFHLILWGLYKKVVIADNLAVSVDQWFSKSQATAAEIFLGTLFFAIQIYCDFSGYSNIARGTARLLGFRLVINFNLPYFARNPQDFWRRWHISLSSWLRDYLYIPLGGNRGSSIRINFNLFATMLLAGLWHGAAWPFIIWGAFHGTLLAMHRFIKNNFPKALSRIPPVIAWAGMSLLTLYGWLIFRANDFSHLKSMTDTLLHGPYDLAILPSGLAKFAYYSWLLILVQVIQYRSQDLSYITKLPWVIQSLFYLICIYSIILLGKYDTQSFIYFQF